MAGSDPNYDDPYFRVTPLPDTQFVQTARPVTLTQSSDDLGDVVNVAADQDVVVFGDVVTIRGNVTVQRPPAQDANGTHPVANGGRVVILARQLKTLPDDKGDAILDLEGAQGYKSPNVWTAQPHNGVGDTGDPGRGVTFGWQSPKAGGTGQSSLDASGKVDPNSPLNGRPGDAGGAGGNGGSVELRCGSLDSGVALGVDVSGGHGGDGLDGQKGAKGGAGGPGDNGGVVRGPSPGGNGGRGGNGGDGGAPGAGGAPGTISIWLWNGSASAITCTLDAGVPGKPGSGGEYGDGGDAGPGGRHDSTLHPELDEDDPSGQPGAHGDPGNTPKPLTQGSSNKVAVTTPCDPNDLVDKLTLPLAPQLAMMLDLLRADYLQATGTASSGSLSDLTDRLNWVGMLATNYEPFEPAEEDALDVVRARVQTMQERLKAGFDYFGNSATYAPLGSLALYQDAFNKTGGPLDVLRTVRNAYDTNLKALDKATATTQELQKAEDDLASQQEAYTDGAAGERTAIDDLITRINGHDADAVAAAQTVIDTASAEFKAAVTRACGLSVGDLVDALGQFAFLGEKELQQNAMYTSQASKLFQTATSKCLTDDGTQVDKKWVIGQLATADDLNAALKEAPSGTINGMKLDDPGAVKLLAKQADLDQLCQEFWSYQGAAELKEAFDDYVSAVQARNADVMTLNESLARLRGYLAGAAQSAASIAEAKDAKSKLSAPGAPALVTQLSRMVARATDDCIFELYRMSRAYWMWSLQPGDELAKQLKDIAADDPLAITPEVLASAAEGLAKDYTGIVTDQLQDAGGWFPKPANESVWYPAPDTRGTRIVFTHDTHPKFIEALRSKRTATIAIAAPRKDTPPSESPFSGYADIRITMVRPWVFGARLTSKNPAKSTIRVDLTHTGHETIMSPDDTVTVVTHDPVDVPAFEYPPDKADDPAAIRSDCELFDMDTPAPTPPPGSLIGPFTRWRVSISDEYNDPSLDLSQVDKVVFEFFGHQRKYPVPAPKPAAAATA